MKNKTTVIVGLAAVAVVGVWLLGKHQPYSEADSSQRTHAVTVTTLEVAKRPVAESVTATGTVAAVERAELAPKIMGKVISVTVREGDHVRAGQLLVRLDSRDLAAGAAQAAAATDAARAGLAQAQTGAVIQRTQSSTRVAQAEAELTAAQEQLSLVKEGPRKQQKAQTDALVAQAEAAEKAAEANLSMVREGARRQQKAQADQAVTQAQAAYDTAEATFQRFKSLFDQEVIPKQRFDEVKMQRDIAKSQLEQAKQQTSLVHEGARTQEVAAAEDMVRQAQASVAAARQQRDMTYEGARQQEIATAAAKVRQAEEAVRMAKAAVAENQIKAATVSTLRAQVRQAQAGHEAAVVMVDYSRITAPFDGVVVSRMVDPGDMASPGAPTMIVESDARYRLECSVPESQVAHLKPGDHVRAEIDALNLQNLDAQVAIIVPGADPASRTVTVKANLPRLPQLRSGLFGRLFFNVGESESILVPQTAVWRQESLTGVFVVEKGVARLQLVELGSAHNGSVAVLSGLSGGETVVAKITAGLADGVPVQISR